MENDEVRRNLDHESEESEEEDEEILFFEEEDIRSGMRNARKVLLGGYWQTRLSQQEPWRML